MSPVKLAVPVLTVLLFLTQPIKALDREAFLWAIRQVETGDDPHLVGTRGERGAYQFSWSTWRQHTRHAFIEAHGPFAHEVALRHLRWIEQHLVVFAEPTVVRLAEVWNAGLTNVRRGHVPAATQDYARRVEALYLTRTQH